jgi:hypothetical protein
MPQGAGSALFVFGHGIDSGESLSAYSALPQWGEADERETDLVEVKHVGIGRCPLCEPRLRRAIDDGTFAAEVRLALPRNHRRGREMQA